MTCLWRAREHGKPLPGKCEARACQQVRASVIMGSCKEFLEEEGDAGGEAVAVLGIVSASRVAVQHAEVITDGEAEVVAEHAADAAAEHDVETAVAFVVVVVGGAAFDLDADDVSGDLRRGGETDGSGRAGIDKEAEVAGQVRAVAEGQGDVDVVLGLAAADIQDAGGSHLVGGQEFIIDARGEVEAGGQGSGVADTCVEAVAGGAGGLAVIAEFDDVGGVDIAGADAHLSECRRTGEQHQGCGKKGNNLFHILKMYCRFFIESALKDEKNAPIVAWLCQITPYCRIMAHYD